MKKKRMILSCMVAVIMTMVMAVPTIVYGEEATVAEPTDVISETTVDEATEGVVDDSGTVVGTDKDVAGTEELNEPKVEETDVDKVTDEGYILVLDKDETETGLIHNDSEALIYGATHKAVIDGVTYYYMEESLVPENVKAERIGWAIDFIAITPTGIIDWENYDRIAVADGTSISDFEKGDGYTIEDLSWDGYDFVGWYAGSCEGVDLDSGRLMNLKYGKAFDFDAPITQDTKLYAAWNKPSTGEPADNNTAAVAKTAKVEKDHSAKTGDDFNGLIYGTVALAALIVLAVVIVTGRRHKA